MSVCNAVIKFCLGLNGTENVSKFLLQKIKPIWKQVKRSKDRANLKIFTKRHNSIRFDL